VMAKHEARRPVFKKNNDSCRASEGAIEKQFIRKRLIHQGLWSDLFKKKLCFHRKKLEQKQAKKDLILNTRRN